MSGESLDRDEGGGGAVFDAEFFEDVPQMLFHRLLAASQDGGDIAVAFPLRDPEEHFGLAGGETEILLEGGW